MNIQMRIITEDNVDQLLSMSYSDNINKLMKSDKSIADTIKDYNDNISNKLKVKENQGIIVSETPEMPDPAYGISDTPTPVTPVTPVESLFDIGDEVIVKDLELRTSFPGVIQSKFFSSKYRENLYEVLYDDGKLEKGIPETRLKLYKKKSPDFSQGTPDYVPNSPDYVPNSPDYNPTSPHQFSPKSPDIPPPNTNTPSDVSSKSSILEIEPPIEEKTLSDSSTSTSELEKSNSEGDSKKIIITKSDSDSSDTTNSSETKKITL